jgi:hypothetical protein
MPLSVRYGTAVRVICEENAPESGFPLAIFRVVSYYKDMETPISKSQTRAMKLAGLGVVDTYEAAASALETARYRKDGVPHGHTWRTAAKLSDADLLAAIVLSDEEIFGRERIEY